jgi:AmiR/NasT family two-component response regulator
MHTRLLIVDADSILRLDLRQLLQAQGYAVVGEAGDGMRAIALARELQPDLVLLDLELADPGDGRTAAATWTAEGMPPVLLMGFRERALGAEAACTEGTGYLIKPFTEEQLRGALAGALLRLGACSPRCRKSATGAGSLRSARLCGSKGYGGDACSCVDRR